MALIDPRLPEKSIDGVPGVTLSSGGGGGGGGVNGGGGSGVNVEVMV